MHQRYISLFWLVFLSQHSEIYNSKALRLAGNMDSQFLSDSVTGPIAGRVRERWEGGLFIPSPFSPPKCVSICFTRQRTGMRWGVEWEEERDVWKRGGEVERIDSVCWTQIKVCLVCRPHKNYMHSHTLQIFSLKDTQSLPNTTYTTYTEN